MAKIATIRLSFPHPNPREMQSDANQLYRVEQVTDSLRHAPGEYLTRGDAEFMCDSIAWKVTIVPVRED